MMDVQSIDEYSALIEHFRSTKTFPEIKSKIDFEASELVSSNANKEEKEQQKHYAIIPVVGPVLRYDSCCSYGSETLAKQLEKHFNDESVAGIVLKVDTPGGSVSAIAPFLEAAKIKNKPVIAVCESACSLGYWFVSALADHIMVENTISSRLGSIGVVCSFKDTRPHDEEKNIKHHEIYADQSEHKNLAFRLAREGKYDMIKEEYLNPMAIEFQQSVMRTRPGVLKESGVLTGKTFGANEAIRLKLADSIGNMRDAFQLIDVMNELNSNS